MSSKYEETIDYELVPDPNSSEAWLIRIMKGEYLETVLQFGGIRFDGTDDDPLLTFDYEVVSSPILGLEPNDPDLQEFAGDLLVSIVEHGIGKGELKTKEVK
jgi:hypothetical protein